MSNIDLYHQISIQSLDQKFYFQSLINKAFVSGLLNDQDISNIQDELIKIFMRQTDQWNHGKSSSIPLEKAQEFMNSIMYVIGIALKTDKEIDEMISILKESSMINLFNKGLEIIQKKIDISHRIHKEIMDHLLDTPNVFYKSTIQEGIKGFFKLYDPYLNADEIHITADYPIFIGRPHLNGIEFIERYLRYIQMENAFCLCFASKNIHYLLCGLAKGYKSIPLNIFEPVILSALGLVIVKRDPKKLDLRKIDIEFLYQYFNYQTDLKQCLNKALIQLNNLIEIPAASYKYAFLCLSKLSCIIKDALKTRTLNKVFLVPRYPEYESRILFSYGDRMNDGDFQLLLDSLYHIEKSKDKVSLIFKCVHSIEDLMDIISYGELNQEDLELLVNKLPISVFKILVQEYPVDDFLIENEKLLFKALKKRRKQAF